MGIFNKIGRGLKKTVEKVQEMKAEHERRQEIQMQQEEEELDRQIKIQDKKNKLERKRKKLEKLKGGNATNNDLFPKL